MPSISEKELAEKLIDVGEKLSSPPSSIDELLKLLDSLEYMLVKVEQAPPKSMLEALLPSMRALVANELLRHTDAAVRVSVTACNNEMIRITAPNAPYGDEQMKEIFHMTLETYEKLSHMSSRCYKKAVSVLDTVVKVRSCLLMLDLACDDLIVDVFDCFLQTIRSDHPHDVFTNMEKVMTLLLDGDDFVPWDLLRTLLNSVKKGNELASPMSWKLGEKVIKNCAVKLKRFLMKAVDSLGVDLNEYAEFVSSIAQTSTDTLEENIRNTSDKQMVASELVPGVEIGAGLDGAKSLVSSDTTQTRNDDNASAEENPSGKLVRCCQINQSESNDIRGNDETGPESQKSGKSEMNSETASKKRVWKPNSLMNPDEGYEHYWIRRGRKSSKLPCPQKSHDKSKVIDDSPSENPGPKEAAVSSSLVVAKVFSPKASESGSLDASPGPDCSLPDGGSLPKRGRRKRKGSMTHQDADPISPSISMGHLFSPPVRDEVPKPEKVSVKKKSEETSVVLTERRGPSKKKEVSANTSGSIGASSAPDRSLLDGSNPKRDRKKKKVCMTQQDADQISSSGPKHDLFSPLVGEKGPQPADVSVKKEAEDTSDVVRKRGKQLKKKEVSANTSGSVGASPTHARSVSDPNHLKRDQKKKKKSTTQQEADENSVSERHLFTPPVVDEGTKPADVHGKNEAEDASALVRKRVKHSKKKEVSANTSRSSNASPTPDCPKRDQKRRKGSMTQQEADEISPSVLKRQHLFNHSAVDDGSKLADISVKKEAEVTNDLATKKRRFSKNKEASANTSGSIGASPTPGRSLPDGNNPKRCQKKKKENMTQQVADENSPSVPKRHLFSPSVVDEGTKPEDVSVRKEAEDISDLVKKQRKLSKIKKLFANTSEAIGVSPTPDCSLPDGDHSKRGQKKKVESIVSMTKLCADPKSSSVPKAHIYSPPIRNEDQKPVDVSVKKKTEDTTDLGTKRQKHPKKKTVSANTIEGSTSVHGNAISKEEGHSGVMEKPFIQSTMNVCPKNINEEGSPIQYMDGVKRRGRPKRIITEEFGEKMSGSTAPLNESVVDVTPKNERKHTPEKEEKISGSTAPLNESVVDVTPKNERKHTPEKEEKISGSTAKSLNESIIDVTPKKRRKRTSGKKEASDTPHSGKDLGEQLVGSKIKVWWPQDKMFYEGIVDSFDPFKKRHKVLYTDGEQEILNLEKQRWKLIGNDVFPDEGKERDGPRHEASFYMIGPSTDKPADDCTLDSPVALDDSKVEGLKKSDKLEDDGQVEGTRSVDGLERLSNLANTEASLNL